MVCEQKTEAVVGMHESVLTVYTQSYCNSIQYKCLDHQLLRLGVFFFLRISFSTLYTRNINGHHAGVPAIGF